MILKSRRKENGMGRGIRPQRSGKWHRNLAREESQLQAGGVFDKAVGFYAVVGGGELRVYGRCYERSTSREGLCVKEDSVEVYRRQCECTLGQPGMYGARFQVSAFRNLPLLTTLMLACLWRIRTLAPCRSFYFFLLEQCNN